MSSSLRLHAVAAMASNRVIGLLGKMPWHVSSDLKFFRKLTEGHPVVMGRKTWDSLGRPLPKRRNIVLTQQPHSFSPAGAEVISSAAALENLPGLEGDVFIIGGAQIYQLFMPLITSLYLTEIDIQPPPVGDAFFPPFEAAFPHHTVLAEESPCRWLHYTRIPSSLV